MRNRKLPGDSAGVLLQHLLQIFLPLPTWSGRTSPPPTLLLLYEGEIEPGIYYSIRSGEQEKVLRGSEAICMAFRRVSESGCRPVDLRIQGGQTSTPPIHSLRETLSRW